MDAEELRELYESVQLKRNIANLATANKNAEKLIAEMVAKCEFPYTFSMSSSECPTEVAALLQKKKYVVEVVRTMYLNGSYVDLMTITLPPKPANDAKKISISWEDVAKTKANAKANAKADAKADAKVDAKVQKKQKWWHKIFCCCSI